MSSNGKPRILTPEIEARLTEFNSRYGDLIWYARSDAAKHDAKTNASIAKSQQEMRQKYPKDCADLDGEHSNWQHGFNSGLLAAVRWLDEALDETMGIEEADLLFPNLYT